MRLFSGKAITDQIVLGRLRFYYRPAFRIQRHTQDNWRKEINRFCNAQQIALRELSTLYHRALSQVGEEAASIFSVHGMLLEDQDYLELIRSLIKGQSATAEQAVQMAEAHFTAAFSTLNSAYMRARAVDICDISQRMLRVLTGNRQPHTMSEPAILVADEFLPSEVMDFDQRQLLGLITCKDGLDSHAALLVRACHIPSIVEVDLPPEYEDHLALMDGCTGDVYVDPEREHVEQVRERYQANGRPRELGMNTK